MRTCLVVDHSNVVRKVARHIFEAMQFEADEAESGQEALDKCKAAMPDAILLDANLPSMGNVEFLSSLRTLPNGSKPLVIYCTIENDPTEITRALTAGADEYLLKPFDRDSVAAKLTAVGLKT
jgi:two-component system, chemotaxis family, chemotaxis protein CheY